MLRFSPPIKLTFHHHRLDMTLAAAEAVTPNKVKTKLPEMDVAEEFIHEASRSAKD